MTNIFKIFFRDLKRILKNPIAIITMIGVCFVPALYAWFNIAANWDPYGSTDGIRVAVANTDKGYKKGENYINIGEEVVNNLKANNQIGWEFISEDDAIEGVKSGEYYAGIVIPPNFSQDLSSVLEGKIKNPTFKYYTNQKKNAIAPKITDKGVNTIKQELNETFVKTVSEVADKILKVSYNKLSDKEKDIFNKIKNTLIQTDEDLNGYKTTIDSFTKTTEAIKSMIEATKLALPVATGITENGSDAVNQINSLIHSSQNFTDAFKMLLENSFQNAENTMWDIWDSLKNINYEADNISNIFILEIGNINNKINRLYEVNSKIITTLRKINEALPIKLKNLEKLALNIEKINEKLKNLLSMNNNIKNALNEGQTLTDTMLSNLNRQIKDIKIDVINIKDSYNLDVKPEIDKLAEKNYKVLNNIYLLMQNTQVGISQISNILDKFYESLQYGNEALLSTKSNIENTQKDINQFKSNVTEFENKIKSEKIAQLLSNDPEIMAKFISAPVKIETVYFYEIENYGSAMSPFYSTLALWVGGVILVSLLKVKVDEDEKIKNIKNYQSYFGRYLLFMCLGLMQALIICLGDLYFLKIQCVEPGLFILSGLLISFVFTNIIYTLTVSFGDIGKALCVFLLVIQIAGSGGTFPIEVTPQFFQNVYPMLPFTYAINSMRETIGGLYENNFYKYIASLLSFIPLSLILGVLLRVPLIKLNEFFEKRLEETHLM